MSQVLQAGAVHVLNRIDQDMVLLSRIEFEQLENQRALAIELARQITDLHSAIDDSGFRDRCDDISFEDRLTQLINIAKAAEARVAELEKTVASNAALVVERDRLKLTLDSRNMDVDAHTTVLNDICNTLVGAGVEKSMFRRGTAENAAKMIRDLRQEVARLKHTADCASCGDSEAQTMADTLVAAGVPRQMQRRDTAVLAAGMIRDLHDEVDNWKASSNANLSAMKTSDAKIQQCHNALTLAGVAQDVLLTRVKNLIAERDQLKVGLEKKTKVHRILAKAVNESHCVLNDAKVSTECFVLKERVQALVAERDLLKKQNSDGGSFGSNVDCLNAHLALDEAKIGFMGTLADRVRKLLKREAETAEKLKEEFAALVRAHTDPEFWKQYCGQARNRLEAAGCHGIGLNACVDSAVTLIANLRNRDAVLTGLLKEVRRDLMVYEDGSAVYPTSGIELLNTGLSSSPTSLGNWVVRVDTMLTGR